MKRRVRFILLLSLSLALVPFLPLYVERTMMRSWRMDKAGDMVEWGWRLCTLNAYWSNYDYYRPEQKPALWLAANLALAIIYGLIAAFSVDGLLARRAKRPGDFG